MVCACCPCTGASGGAAKASLPLICLVPRGEDRPAPAASRRAAPSGPSAPGAQSDFQLLDEDYIKKHFKLPQRPLYLDPFRRPLITFPMTTQEDAKHFNLAKKYKINQQILDGFLDPSEAISAPSVFACSLHIIGGGLPTRLYQALPGCSNADMLKCRLVANPLLSNVFKPTIMIPPYAKTETEKRKEAGDDEEIIYILQLPDWEYKCPVHNETIRTPRFIWHSCKKTKGKSGELKQGGGPLNKPKPWLLSRHTDFDLLSQWPLARTGFDALNMSAPVLVQMNPEGKWENTKPGNLDEERLKAVVQHLISSKAVSAAHSYCCQCAAQNKSHSSKSNYVPVIMMPIYPAEECPFDMKCEIQKAKEFETKTSKQKTKTSQKDTKESEKEKDKKKLKKRGFVMQRLTDFDLLSQW